MTNSIKIQRGNTLATFNNLEKNFFSTKKKARERIVRSSAQYDGTVSQDKVTVQTKKQETLIG
jgi:hypothetical protein